MKKNCSAEFYWLLTESSSLETERQIVGVRESVNGQEKMAKVKNGEKSPCDNVLPDQVQTVACHFGL